MGKETPQAAAAREAAEIRDLLYVLGSATEKRVAEELNLPLTLVRRRLVNGGPGVHEKQWQRFCYDKETKLWSLTALGWRESDHAMKNG